MRPMVLAVVSGGEVPEALISARGEQGRAAERIAFAYLAQVRGEAGARGARGGSARPDTVTWTGEHAA
jgi:hypothetical protein